MGDIKTYKVNGQVYEIPDGEKDAFLKDFPKAEEVVSFVANKDTFDIPVAEVSEFTKEMPNAKPLKKKDGWEPISTDLPKDSTVGLGTVLKSESPSPLQDKPLSQEPEPPAGTAKTFGEWVTGAAGVFNKGLANTFDQLDYLQTTAGDAVAQILLGKDNVNELQSLRESGALVSPMPMARPFEAAADALRWASSGTKELPSTTTGQVVKGIAGVAPDILAVTLLPEVKSSQMLAKYGVPAASKFGMLLGGKEAVQNTQDATTVREQLTSPVVGAIEGYMTGMLFDGFGVASESIGKGLASKILPNALDVNKELAAKSSSVLTNAILFGGYGTAEELLRTGEATSNTFFVNAGMGLGLGTYGVGKALYAKGVSSFMSSSDADISRIAKTDITPQELMDNGIRKVNDIENNPDKPQSEKENDLAAAVLNVNTAIKKAFIEEVKDNPEKVKDDINESDIPKEVKEDVTKKIDNLVASEDPNIDKLAPLRKESKDIDKKIQSLKKNEAISDEERDIELASLKQRKEEIKQEVINIKTPKDEAQKETMQTQGQQEVKYTKPEVIPSEGKKGNIVKTNEGYAINESILGPSLSNPEPIIINSLADVPAAKERINNFETKAKAEIDARNTITDSEYQVGSKTYPDRESFLTGLLESVKDKTIDPMFVYEDIKYGPDVKMKEVMDIITENASKESNVDVPMELTSSSELAGIMDEVVPRVNKRIDQVEKLITDEAKQEQTPEVKTEGQAETTTPKEDVKAETDQISPSEPKVEQSTATGKIMDSTSPDGVNNISETPYIGDSKTEVPFDAPPWIVRKWNAVMKARGNMPKSVFESWLKSRGEVNAAIKHIRFIASDGQRAYADTYGKDKMGRIKITAEDITQLNDALANLGEASNLEQRDAVLATIPEGMRDYISTLRDEIDNSSKELQKLGLVEGELDGKISDNLGFYLHRTYRVHNDKTWFDPKNPDKSWENIPVDIRNEAIASVREEFKGKDDAQIEAILKSMLYDQSMPLGVLRSQKLLPKNLGILKKRLEALDKNPSLRALMGENKDPIYNYATSVAKMAEMMSKHKFLKELREQGLNKFLFEEPQGKFVAKIVPKNSPTMDELSEGKPLYTLPYLADVFNNFGTVKERPGDVMRTYFMVNAAMKMGKTVGSPQTHVRNFISNYMFHVAAGRDPFILNKGGVLGQVATNALKNKRSPEWRAYAERLVRLGVVDDNANANELYDIIKDGYNEFTDFAKGTDTFLKNPVKKSIRATVGLYQAEDNVHKIYAFEYERKRYEDIIKKQNPEASPEEIDRLLDEKAALIVRETMPTYSLVPEVVKQLRKTPLVGTFVSFPAEVFRTSYNTIDLAIREMSNQDTYKMGLTRMMGIITAATLPAAVAYNRRRHYGISKSDSKDLRRFMPSYAENTEPVFIKHPEKGVYSYIDPNYSDPYNYLKQIFYSAIDDTKDSNEAIITSISTLLSPFLSEELMASKLIDLSRNTKNGVNGSQIYNPADSRGDRAKDMMDYMYTALKPGALVSIENINKGLKGIKQGTKVYNAKDEIMAVFTGQRVTNIDVGQSFSFKARKNADMLSSARWIYGEALRNKDVLSEAELQDAYDKANESAERIIQEMREDYLAAVRLKAFGSRTRARLSDAMKDARVSDVVYNMVKTGRYQKIDKKTGSWITPYL